MLALRTGLREANHLYLRQVMVKEIHSHTQPVVKWEPSIEGYLRFLVDSLYLHFNNLTQKSDVYGFGVVLLEMITGLPPIIRSSTNDEKRNLVDWARPIIATRDIQAVLDPRLEGDYDAYSLSKVAEIALACMSPRSIERPTMTDIVAGVFLVGLFFSICLSPDSLSNILGWFGSYGWALVC
ncbi:putative LRR receptor-like serine/threonine-protein kinase [Cinnamomum micranthum f. kanehirae]|uniref:Putative LRR receptor-like serine/threonine-protein kinase n=1 Tax=Cinnamomum micranthum f. kanehirae TaxID=337451 RepID=A0A3S3NM31_9MAGN|nr:putative LRR receptor-like serine/threonine-protein kinase [Cinnamomum micranthum f. kanehirae]